MKKPSGLSRRLLETALDALKATESCAATLDDRLDAAPLEMRRLLSHLLLTYHRRKLFIDGLIALYAARPPRPELRRLLALALTQIYFQSAIAPESAANVAVETAKPLGGGAFVNAILRRALREKRVPRETPDAVFPDALLKRWQVVYTPGEIAKFTAAFLTEPALTFRIERGAVPDFPCVEVESPAPELFHFAQAASATTVLESAEFKAGRLYIQDPAAGLAPSLGDLSRAGSVLDLCAAPGGKALMLGERMPSTVILTAADRSARRQRLTAANFALRQLPYRVVTASPEDLTGCYDFVLADCPCSNTGVFRRRPDALWRFNPAALESTLKLQLDILNQAARLTAPGGQLIYSTCSIESEENHGQVMNFIAAHPEFSAAEERCWLPTPAHDGAFAARLIRRG